MSITFYEGNNDRQERAANAQIADRARAFRNAGTWSVRAIAARTRGEVELARNLDAQAALELRKYRTFN